MTTAPAPRVAMISLGSLKPRARRVALLGNPNVGKSSLFNVLTGMHQRVSNYPGTTVERLTGTFTQHGSSLDIVDLPGTYSLLPRSPDEAVVRDELLGRVAGDPRPDVLCVVLDATNLERNLFLATQAFETGIPVVVALNQVDLAIARGVDVDPRLLGDALGVPVIATCGRTGQGRDALAQELFRGGAVAKDVIGVPDAALCEGACLFPALGDLAASPFATQAHVARALLSEGDSALLQAELVRRGRPDAATAVHDARARLAAQGADVATGLADHRYAAIDAFLESVAPPATETTSRQRALDRWLTHPVVGTLVMIAVFALVFASIFWWSTPLMDLVEAGVGVVKDWAGAALGEGLFSSFVVDGVIEGFGAFLVFVPQIAVFFLILQLLDDSGYLSRAAFLLDRAMGRFGLPGRAFVPLLGGFACAIPGILSARTISNTKDRYVTMAVLPLMSCSARLPVYFLLLAAAFSGAHWWVTTAVVASMYLAGILVAIACSSVLRRTVFKGGRTPLLLELPPYRWPSIPTVARSIGRRTWSFVAGAGPVILGLTIVLWVLLTFPRDVPAALALSEKAAAAETAGDAGAATALRDEAEAAQQEGTYMGQAGKLIEPTIRPLGFDWKMGVGILASFAAREVFVPTLGVIYAVGDEADEENVPLRESMQRDKWPDGRPVYTPLSAISLMVFYVIALQCMSTLAVLKREMGGWKWPIGLFVAYTVLAYLASLLVWQVGIALGF